MKKAQAEAAAQAQQQQQALLAMQAMQGGAGMAKDLAQADQAEAQAMAPQQGAGFPGGM